jgi:hypothetical protein
MDFVEIRKGNRSPFGPGRQTVIRRGGRLLTRIRDHKLTLTDVQRDHNVLADPLVVRAPKITGKRGRTCNVTDTDVARGYRAQMDRINAWIAAADISCYFARDDGREVTDDDRFLRRIFNNGSLEQGGRLFGGFWQHMGKAQRLSEIFIEGELVVALDFGQMAARIAYGIVKATPPPGDLYSVPPFEFFRKGIKAVLNALLASDRMPERFPMGTRSAFPSAATIADVIKAISQRHPALVPLFGSGACHQIFFLESEVLIATLLRLIDLGVVALPIHDCLLVACSKKHFVRRVMLEVFREKTGVHGEVEEE